MAKVIEGKAGASGRPIYGGGRGNRSNLYLVMLADHSDLAADIAARGARWPERAAKFAAGGLVDGAGNPPSPETCRHTWLRVRKDMAAAALAAEAAMLRGVEEAEAAEVLARRQVEALASHVAAAAHAAMAALLAEVARAQSPADRATALDALLRLTGGAGVIAPLSLPMPSVASPQQVPPASVHVKAPAFGEPVRQQKLPVESTPQKPKRRPEEPLSEADRIRKESKAALDLEYQRQIVIAYRADLRAAQGTGVGEAEAQVKFAKAEAEYAEMQQMMADCGFRSLTLIPR
jgi:hypothetical protein